MGVLHEAHGHAAILGIREGDAMREQETRGKVKNLKGRMKEAVGIVTGDKTVEREGSQQRAEGTVQENVGKARRKVGEFVEGVAKKIQS